MRTKIALSLSLLVALPAVHAQEPVVANEYQLVEQRLETLGLDLYRLLVQVAPHIAEQLHQLPESIQSALSQPGNQELIVTLESLIEAAQIAIKLVKAGATVEHNEALVSLCAQATQVLEDIDVLLGGSTSDDATRGGILKVVPSLLAGVIRVENRFLCTGTAEFNPPAGTVALRVNGESTFNGDVNISGRLVIGDNNILTTQVVNDNVMINGNLDVSGTTTLNKLVVNGDASITGTTTLNLLNVNSDATFADNINMQNTNSSGSVGVINKGSIRFMHNGGTQNTFLGQSAGTFNPTGTANVGVGYNALNALTSGTCNIAVGGDALKSNTTGQFNICIGCNVLNGNLGGSNNVAVGSNALANGSGADQCVAVGTSALQNSSSPGNIAIGYQAGSAFALLNNNIMIGNGGVGLDTNTIRFGNGSHTALYLMATGAGATGLPGNAVATQNLQIDPTTGAVTRFTSSARYKEDIKAMTTNEIAMLEQLNPVTYVAKGTQSPRCYGLIAEEVAQVAKDLVIFNADDQPEAVRYEALVPMLLAAYRTLHAQHAELVARVEQLESR